MSRHLIQTQSVHHHMDCAHDSIAILAPSKIALIDGPVQTCSTAMPSESEHAAGG